MLQTPTNYLPISKTGQLKLRLLKCVGWEEGKNSVHFWFAPNFLQFHYSKKLQAATTFILPGDSQQPMQ